MPRFRMPEFYGRAAKGQMSNFCHECFQSIPDGEPVYQYRTLTISPHDMKTICQWCLLKKRRQLEHKIREDGGEHMEYVLSRMDADSHWQSRPCLRCDRLVFRNATHHSGYKYPLFPKHLLCGAKCKSAYWGTIARERRAHDRPPIKCAVCDTRFMPTRTDALYCSPACRQWAYRRR
jgi:hypothetical protein